MPLHRKGVRIFLSTPSARRATGKLEAMSVDPDNFYPRPPQGGRLVFIEPVDDLLPISIHALREEGDEGFLPFICCLNAFLSTPSARRATPAGLGRLVLLHISIHALREEGDLAVDGPRHPVDAISIHALREEGDILPSASRCWKNKYFYPRPPRGGRRVLVDVLVHRLVFLSTPSARRATAETRTLPRLFRISIHALREEGDSADSFS